MNPNMTFLPPELEALDQEESRENRGRSGKKG